ncbi:hypothetical protein FB451DRAFT_1278965 [Mycena latifolia]|nr:hypothetical protein FB451DRAFT_1278965 [Mycena latifolia]
MSIFLTPIDCHVATSIPAPSAAATRLERSSTIENTTNPVDDFFGYTLASSRTRDSRHDRRISTAESAVAPPPYVEAPEYAERAKEPVTLAMFLFKFGFLFPPFWIMSVVILMSPLRAPPAATPSAAWLPEKTDAERQVIIDRMRTAELKWAKRCLYALLAFVLAVAVIAVAVWATHRS